MKLKDLLPVINEHTDVSVIMNGTEIAVYDGKNSIPKDLDEAEILNISASGWAIGVEVKSMAIVKSMAVPRLTMSFLAEFEIPILGEGGCFKASFTTIPIKITVDGTECTIGFKHLDATPVAGKPNTAFIMLWEPEERNFREGFDALTYDAVARGNISIAENEQVVAFSDWKVKRISKVTLGEATLKITKAQPETGRKE